MVDYEDCEGHRLNTLRHYTVDMTLGLFFVYVFLPQIEKYVDIPLAEDRDERPDDQLKEDYVWVRGKFGLPVPMPKLIVDCFTLMLGG